MWLKSNSNKVSHSKQGVTAGLDIGTTKVCAIVAEPNGSSNSVKILGIGITESQGINRGVVVNIDKTVKTIQTVVAQAEQQSGFEIKDFVIGIAGDHIESIESRGVVGISGLTHEISRDDVERALEDSRKIALPSERQIIHVIPQDFIIDGQDGITDPVGISGVRMEANVHIVTGLSTAIQNIYRCVERAELNVKEIILEPLASSSAILSDEEKEVGVAIIDIGGGTTDIAVFHENIIRWTSVFGIAGRKVTDDIRLGLNILANQAERVKHTYGHAFQGSIHKDEIFMIPGIGGRRPIEVTKSYLCHIIQPRIEEIFEFAMGELRRSGYSDLLGAGIVLTGGTSLLRGIDELAEQCFQMPVKIGIPSGITYAGLGPEIESPVYSTAVGLALHAMNKNKPVDEHRADNEPKILRDKPSIFNRIKGFVEEI